MGLTGVGQAIFRGAQLFHQLQDRVVGLELRIGLAHGEQPPEGDAESLLALLQGVQGDGILRPGLGLVQAGLRLLARRHHRLQRFALVLQIALHRFHQIGDEIVPAGELDIDLGEGVAVGVTRRDQSVVEADREQAESDQGSQQEQQFHRIVLEGAENFQSRARAAAPAAQRDGCGG